MAVIILENKLTKKERKDREIPLIKAKNWINSAAQGGGVSAYAQQNFLKPGSKDIRNRH